MRTVKTILFFLVGNWRRPFSQTEKLKSNSKKATQFNEFEIDIQIVAM